MLVVQISNHFILVIDVLFNLVNIARGLPVVLFLSPVHRLWSSFRHRQYVLDCVGNDEVLARLQSLHWLLMNTWDWSFFMVAIIGEVLWHRKLLVAHCPRFRFQKFFWIGFTITFKLTKSFGLPELSVRLETTMKLARQVMPLD